MTQEEKDLLLKDLCARVPYEVKLQWAREIIVLNENWLKVLYNHPEEVKPYLRPMSSMTEEEREKFRGIGGIMSYSPQHDTWALSVLTIEGLDWLNAHHFDYRGLIEKGLALEAPEENNPYR